VRAVRGAETGESTIAREVVAFRRPFLGARLQHLDRARDCSDRRPQLVSGVRDELALDPLVPLELGDVRDHEERRSKPLRRRDPADRVVRILPRRDAGANDLGVAREQAPREAPQRKVRPRIRQGSTFLERAEQLPGGAVRGLDDEVGVDRDDSLVETLERSP